MVLLTKKKGAGTRKEVSLKSRKGQGRLPSGTLWFDTGVQRPLVGKIFVQESGDWVPVLAVLCLAV